MLNVFSHELFRAYRPDSDLCDIVLRYEITPTVKISAVQWCNEDAVTPTFLPGSQDAGPQSTFNHGYYRRNAVNNVCTSPLLT